MPQSNHAQRGRLGGLKSWANTPDRNARLAPARAKNPSSVEWHLARLDPDKFANATDEQKHAAAEAARRFYYQQLAYASAKARRRGAA